MSLPAVQRHRGLSAAVFLAISSILTFRSIATLPVQEEKSCPDPLAQHSPGSELLPAVICVGRMLTAIQPLAVLTAGCITVFILVTATSHKILLRHGVAPGLGAEKQLSHHNYGETRLSASQGCWAALVPPVSGWRGQGDPQDTPSRWECRQGLPSLHIPGLSCSHEWVMGNEHTQGSIPVWDPRQQTTHPTAGSGQCSPAASHGST